MLNFERVCKRVQPRNGNLRFGLVAFGEVLSYPHQTKRTNFVRLPNAGTRPGNVQAHRGTIAIPGALGFVRGRL